MKHQKAQHAHEQHGAREQRLCIAQAFQTQRMEPSWLEVPSDMYEVMFFSFGFFQK